MPVSDIKLLIVFTDIKKRYIVLVMNYHVVPRDIKADLTELVSINSLVLVVVNTFSVSVIIIKCG